MAGIPRRTFLQGAAATVGGAVIGPALQTLMAEAAGGHPGHPIERPPLGPVADKRDGIVRLWLPPGFAYRSFHDTDGAPLVLSDGTVLPGRHDGMAAFRARKGHGHKGSGRDGAVWLVRNHEVNAPGPAFGPSAPGADDAPYDPMAQGGTTSALVTEHGEVIEAFTSLNGTQMNCSGGRMPWGSWITCEETVNGPDVGADFTGVLERPADEAARLPVRGAGGWQVEPPADHQRRTLRPRSGRLQPARRASST